MNAPIRYVLLAANGVSVAAITVAHSMDQAAEHFAAHVRGANKDRVRVSGPAVSAVDGSVTMLTGEVRGATCQGGTPEAAPTTRRRASGSARIARQLMGGK